MTVATAAICLLAFAADGQTRRVVYMPDNQSSESTGPRIYEYDYVDHQPQFPGGDCELMHFINNARRYPADAYERGVQGRVLCSFVVGPDGSISNIRVVKGVEDSLNREAMRVISQMPRWEAGTVNGQAVAVHCLLPIAFRR